MFQLNQKFPLMLRRPPDMLAFFLPFLLQSRMLHRKVSPLLSRPPKKSGTCIREGKNSELDGFCQRRDLQQRQIYSRSLSCYLLADRQTLPTYQNMPYSASKMGKLTANLGNFCSGRGPAGCGEALCKPRQMEKVEKPLSLSFCRHSAPSLSANTESLLLSPCVYTHPSPCRHLLIPATSHQGHRVPQHLQQRQSSWV